MPVDQPDLPPLYTVEEIDKKISDLQSQIANLGEIGTIPDDVKHALLVIADYLKTTLEP